MSENKQFNILISLIIGTVKNLSFYPKKHPTIQTAIRKINEIFHKIMSTHKEVVIAVIKNTLLVEKIPFYITTKGIEEFIDTLSKIEVNGIVFYRTINEREILILLENLTIPAEELKKANGIAERLKSLGVKGIEIKKIEEDVKTEIFKTYTAARDEIVHLMSEIRLGHIPEKTTIKEIINDLNEAMLKDKNTLLCLTMLQDYDEYTFNHSVNVGILSLTLAQELGFNNHDLFNIGLSGILHDIGKTRIQRAITLKPSKLNQYEWDEMKRHPLHGRDIIKEIGGISDITAYFVLYHHLRYNLTGYPKSDGISSQPEGSKIVSIADTYDSMTTLRPYQKRSDPKESIELLKRRGGEDFDPDYVKAFTTVLGIYPIGSVVRLDTNEVGVVIKTNNRDPQRPSVKLILDASGNTINQTEELSLEEKNPSNRQYKRTIVTTAGSSQRSLINLNKYLK